MPHRILILGAGNVGGALGRGWLARGHDVRFGVRDPRDSKHGDLPPDRLQPADERRDADVVVLATPYAAATRAIAALGDLTGAIVLDCTNPLAMGPEGLGLAVGFTTSGGEQVAAAARGAAVFKTFNQTGAENMARAEAFSPRPVMFIAGDDAAKKPTVLALVGELGFDAVDAGPLRNARLLEPLAMLWIDLVMSRGQQRDIAFALVRPQGDRR
jgi:predicted dinucleotide-binding enzyme